MFESRKKNTCFKGGIYDLSPADVMNLFEKWSGDKI